MSAKQIDAREALNKNLTDLDVKRKNISTVVTRREFTDDEFEQAKQIFSALKMACGAWQFTIKTKSDEAEYIYLLCERLVEVQDRDPSLISSQSISNAIRKLENRLSNDSQYLPSVAKFVQLIVEEVYIPTPVLAYVEACKKGYSTKNSSWSHIAIKIAADRADWYNLRTKRQDEIFPIFKDYYARVLAEISGGVKFDVKEPHIVVKEKLVWLQDLPLDEQTARINRNIKGARNLRRILSEG